MATRSNVPHSNPRSKSAVILKRLQSYSSPGLLSPSEDEPPMLATIVPFLVKTRSKRRQGAPKRPRTFTLDEAFSYYFDPKGVDRNAFHLERAIRAIAYLLTWSTVGNDPLDGFAANGLARILERCADRSRR